MCLRHACETCKLAMRHMGPYAAMVQGTGQLPLAFLEAMLAHVNTHKDLQAWRTILQNAMKSLTKTTFTDTATLQSRLFALDVLLRPAILKNLLVHHALSVMQCSSLCTPSVSTSHARADRSQASQLWKACRLTMAACQCAAVMVFNMSGRLVCKLMHACCIQRVMMYAMSTYPGIIVNACPQTHKQCLMLCMSHRLLCCWKRWLLLLASLGQCLKQHQFWRPCCQVQFPYSISWSLPVLPIHLGFVQAWAEATQGRCVATC